MLLFAWVCGSEAYYDYLDLLLGFVAPANGFLLLWVEALALLTHPRCQPRVSMANPVLSAGLGAYVAVLEYQGMRSQCGERKRDIATRKAALRALRDCIVEAYLRDAQAAGWSKWQYRCKDVFQQSIVAHCFSLPMMAYEQLTHAFILRVRADVAQDTPPDGEPVKINLGALRSSK